MRQFIPSSTCKAPPGIFGPDSDGKSWLYAQTHDALVAKTPYFITLDEYGQLTAAPHAGVCYTFIGIPDKAYAASGMLAKLQIGGFCEDVVTPSLTVTIGHAFGMAAGVVTDEATDFTGIINEWAVNCTDSSSAAATAHDMMLCGRIVVVDAS